MDARQSQRIARNCYSCCNNNLHRYRNKHSYRLHQYTNAHHYGKHIANGYCNSFKHYNLCRSEHNTHRRRREYVCVDARQLERNFSNRKPDSNNHLHRYRNKHRYRLHQYTNTHHYG